jgi:hypothetical protein
MSAICFRRRRAPERSSTPDCGRERYFTTCHLEFTQRMEGNEFSEDLAALEKDYSEAAVCNFERWCECGFYPSNGGER